MFFRGYLGVFSWLLMVFRDCLKVLQCFLKVYEGFKEFMKVF